jgi:diguanylate cyclase (GGDEF)-like protein
MKPTDQTLLEQLKITDREINRRLEYLQVTEEDAKVLVNLKPVIASQVDILANEFYQELISFDEVARIIGDAESLSRLKKSLRQYVLDLFDGVYKAEYVQSRLRIGLVHKRIGVPPKLYIFGIHVLKKMLRKMVIAEADKNCRACDHKLNALDKIILFDLTLVFDTYIHGLMDELAKGKEELERYSHELEEKVAERTRDLRDMARLDGLTSLYNQRSFYEESRREYSRARRLSENLSLIYLDLDGFKAINDTFGHKKGDEILTNVAEVIRKSIRAEDIAARYGGDEFCIILPNTSLDNAQKLAERLIEVFKENMGDSEVTLSIGIANTNTENILDYEFLVKKADAAMYQSKNIKGHAVSIAELGRI